MKCFFCKGHMEIGITNFMTDVDNCFIIIKNVPAKVCSQCGEAVFDMKIALRLEELVNTMKSMCKTEVAIINFDEKAA